MIQQKRVHLRIFVSLSLLCSLFLSSAHADTGESAESYLEAARPYLHHSCKSVWEAVNEDEDKLVVVIGKLLGVTFYNHEFDIERLEALSQNQKETLKKTFYEEIGKRCKEDHGALFARVVEGSAIEAITNVSSPK